MARNILQYTDSYKPTMWNQYPDDAAEVYSYVCPREGGRFDNIRLFGLQAFIKEWLLKPITTADVSEMEEMCALHFGRPDAFKRSVFDRVVNAHGGYLPLEITSLPEGSIVQPGLPVAAVRNTDRTVNAFMHSITTYLETAILPAIWYPSTVATVSQEIMDVIKVYMERTCDTLDKLPFMLHDFGTRGVSSFESAELGGLGHLSTGFMGTDNVPALFAGRKYYHSKCAGYSIPAMEHSTVTSWGRLGEVQAYSNMLTRNGQPGGLVAMVSDSYDLDHAVKEIFGKELKQQIIDSGCTAVIRPDTGDPVEISLRTIHNLGEAFGYEVNAKGYKVLNNVRVIYGDGIDLQVISKILETMTSVGWSADNIAFGMGGALLQHCDRDWGRWAMKCSMLTTTSGREVHVKKDPITDRSKKSMSGKFIVTEAVQDKYTVHERKKYICRNVTPETDPDTNLLRTVYRNGELFIDETLDEIRARC